MYVDYVRVYQQANNIKDDLNQNNFINIFPNPFNSITTIQYSLPEKNDMTLKIYDIFGKEIIVLANEIKALGNYEVLFEASDLNAGVYLCQLKTKEYINTKKMILIK